MIYMRCVLALMVMATALSAQQPTHPAQSKSKTAAKSTASSKSSTNQTAATKSNAKPTTARAHATTSSRRLVNGRWVTVSRRSARPPKPVGQQHPESSRYQEIQKALQDRGYFKGEPNGDWNDDSADALKRFQADQKLPNDGKLNSLTLIGLGLGPKHESGPLTPPSPSNLPPATPPPISPETVPAPNRPQ
jgi:hypothetical protein